MDERVKKVSELMDRIVNWERVVRDAVLRQQFTEAAGVVETIKQLHEQIQSVIGIVPGDWERVNERNKETGMANVRSLYKEYFQKSRVFLYPALEIRKGSSITPIQTHISWEEAGVRSRDRRLICLYHLREDKEYLDFEKSKLKGNKLFSKLLMAEEIDPGKPLGVYIFNFDQYDRDWDEFLRGRYSKMSQVLKRKVKDFFRPTRENPNDTNYAWVESFLHPEKYYSIYSELLGVSIDTLRVSGELINPPDLEREALKVKMKQMADKFKITK